MSQGEEALPRVYPSVVHMLDDAADRAPEATAIVCAERRLTYAEYRRCIAGFSHELAALGARGSRVALILGNSVEMAIAMFATHAVGAQATPINPIYTARELAHIVRDAQPAVLLYDGDSAAVVESLLATLAVPVAIRLGEGGRLLDIWQSDERQRLPLPMPRPEDLATLQYTGGTTGLPKGVNITHGQMSVNISQREAALPTRAEDESVVCVMPLFHVFAVAMCLHLACHCRGKLVVMPRYRPDWLLETMRTERITRLPAGPTVFIGLMGYEGFAQADFSSLRTCYSGSAPLPEETLKRWQEFTGTPILEGFGQTEAGPVLTYVREGAVIKPGSSGQALPRTEIEIVDANDGTTRLPVGEVGEVRARGPQVMAGYRNRPQETAEALRDGWLYTGDLGELDADGYLYIRDRKKDMVIVGGYNVYPREVDEVLHAHAGIAEAAAVGVPDTYRGEVIRAYVVRRPGHRLDAEEVLEHCRINLARYKVPVSVEFVDGLPRTTVGKIDKKALRENAPAA